MSLRDLLVVRENISGDEVLVEKEEEFVSGGIVVDEGRKVSPAGEFTFEDRGRVPGRWDS